MHVQKTQDNLEVELREAVLENFMERRAARFGMPKSHIVGFKLIEEISFWDCVVFSYDIFLITQKGIATLSRDKFCWEGHLGLAEAEKIFLHLLKKNVLISKRRKIYFNLEYKDITFDGLQALLRELDKKGVLSKVAPSLAARKLQMFSHDNTVGYVLRVLKKSIVEIEKTNVKISCLGGANVSKSTVFRVIETAGDYVVVKVDPVNLTWKKYINDLRNQRKVARLLGPEVQTLVPGVTYALADIKYLQIHPKYNHMFFYHGNLSAKEQDVQFGDLMLEQTDKDDKLRELLRVGEGYGYFMPYLNEGMLQEHLNNIHGFLEIPGSTILRIDQDIEKELSSDFHIFRKFGFKHFFKKYPHGNKKLLEFIQKQFLGNKYSQASEFWDVLKKRMIKDSADTVFEAYKKIVAAYLLGLYLDADETKKDISQIFSGLLHLFPFLREKGIAIRDLKAGNSFIPDHLNEKGVLGLLDFETSIIYKTSPMHPEISQPRLGGTPSRGTPSLWFSNEVLAEYYGELERALYLPDLYAMIDVIFYGITRESLFKKGKEILQDSFKIIEGELGLNYFKMQRTPANHDEDDLTCVLDSTVMGHDSTMTEHSDGDMSEVYKTVNSVYWQYASREFQQETKKKKNLLDKINIDLPDKFIESLKTEIQLNCELLQAQLSHPSRSSEQVKKELMFQQKLLNMPMKNMPAYRLLHILFLTVMLFMNRAS